MSKKKVSTKDFYLDHTRRAKTAVDPKFKPVGGLDENIEEVDLDGYLKSPYSATIVTDGAPDGFAIPEKKKKKKEK